MGPVRHVWILLHTLALIRSLHDSKSGKGTPTFISSGVSPNCIVSGLFRSVSRGRQLVSEGQEEQNVIKMPASLCGTWDIVSNVNFEGYMIALGESFKWNLSCLIFNY